MVFSRFNLRIKAFIFRVAYWVVASIDRRWCKSIPIKPSLRISIPSTISPTSGKIPLVFYTSKSSGILRSASLIKEELSTSNLPRPVLINFHGGGFTLGGPEDDARWASAVLMNHKDAVVVSVGYRLAPENPFPTAIEDCVDAILWLCKHAEPYNLDRTRFVLSGFSAGGNLTLTVPIRLHEELQGGLYSVANNSNAKAHKGVSEIKLSGLIAFYPGTDCTRTRDQRTASNPISREKSKISPTLMKLFDDSYLYVPDSRKIINTKGRSYGLDLSSPYISPGLTPTPQLLAAYPPCVAIYTCGWDQLLVEGNAFRARLQGLEKDGKLEYVGGRPIKGVIHGWDKVPTFSNSPGERERVYGEAVQELRIMWHAGKSE
jgi:putative ergosteryl-3beta-O-L-aspartate hydrolase